MICSFKGYFGASEVIIVRVGKVFFGGYGRGIRRDGYLFNIGRGFNVVNGEEGYRPFRT